MNKVKSMKLFCLALMLFIIGYGLIHMNRKSYTYEELIILPESELYDVFIDYGFNVDDELKKYLTEKQIKEMLKQDFDLLIKGNTPRSHLMYLRFAKETERVYKLIIYPHR